MKKILCSVLCISGFLTTSAAKASTSNYQYCSTDGCRTGGSNLVTSDYAKTKYPLVFAHGLTGFSSLGGGFDYWYGIPQNLTTNGANVFVTQEAAMNSSTIRGEQLLNQVQQILAITGEHKVNLIGHSQGAQTVRYVAAVIPNQVASATTIGGANGDIPIANLVYNLTQTSAVGTMVITPVLETALNSFFTIVGIASGHYYDQNSLSALSSLDSTGIIAFNAQFPAAVPTQPCGQGAPIVNGVRYYSWTGIGKYTNPLNPASPLMLAMSIATPSKNDGIVPQCSSHLGQVIRDDYNQNHLDEVNQIAGLTDIFSVSPVTLYRQHANRLKVAGL